MSNRILLVDDEPFNLDLLEQELAEQGHFIATCADGFETLAKIPDFQPDLILLDYMMPGMTGLEVLKEIRAKGLDVPVVIVTAHGTIERAVEAMKEGADDFITKPFDPDHLAIVVEKALERTRLRQEVRILAEELGARFQMVTGKSPLMAQAVNEARKAAITKSTVLLLGESGTGKEIFARAIHNWSPRKSAPFIPINCVGLSKELLESELFGHEKGAFTGAHQLKKGKVELAEGGTIFLDEVGDISAELQAKLLRFLQEREFERVGGTRQIKVDVRIVAATNRELEKAVIDGGFREDLYHRLNVIPITLAPLRQRREDISELAAHFLRRFSIETKRPFSQISPAAEAALIAYDWPGNVRELANVIERAVVLGDGPTLIVDSLPSRISGSKPAVIAEAKSYHDAVNLHRRDLILKALADAHGNRAAAAKGLGLHRTHLLKIMKALQLS